jgi:hypothetical protein
MKIEEVPASLGGWGEGEGEGAGGGGVLRKVGAYTKADCQD